VIIWQDLVRFDRTRTMPGVWRRTWARICPGVSICIGIELVR
jgi:hypothetical protein